ncbi:MAG: adenosine deaminase [Acidobacteriota bacterium]|jgi:adenosine deaminase|nr:adenosine deaminase [Acidobacteriota bacterium]
MGETRELLLAQIQDLPKIDLHRHLLGSARPETLWELSRRYKLDVGRKPFDEFKRIIVHKSPPSDLAEYIRPWKLFREVIRSPDDVRRITLEAAKDARLDGVRYVEFRSSLPGMPITDGDAPQTRIPVNEYLQAIREGFSEVPGVVCRLVVSVTRHAVGPAKSSLVQKYAERFLDAAERFRDELVVGVDLTGIESGWPASLFKDFFAEARSLGLPVTVHAGETEGPEEVWAAIDELGASRIGHGTSAPNDARLVEELIRRKVVLEVCPTAGWLVRSVRDRHRHPVINCVPQIPYVICTDNPTLNASTHSHELYLAAQIAGVEPESFLRSQFQLASEAAFAPAALIAAFGPGSWEEEMDDQKNRV